MTILKVDNIVKQYGGLKVLKGATLDVSEGNVVGLVGPNGSGKTTLLNIIYGLLKADEGKIIFQDTDITGFAPHKLYRQGMSFSFQIPRLFTRLTVMDNLHIASRDQVGESLTGALFMRHKWRSQERKLSEKAESIMELMGLTHLARNPAAELSGGQRKLLEVGRALMADPKMMLLDEPAAGVNPVLGKTIYQRLRQLAGQGRTFLVVEHKLDMMLDYADWVYMIDQGKILLSGPPRDVIEHPEFFTTYAGEKKNAAS